MRRFAARQADLFAPPDRQPDLFAKEAPGEPARDPLDELSELLAMLRAAERLPWRDAAATMAEELRALGLARAAGPEGAELAQAVMVETERLLCIADRENGG